MSGSVTPLGPFPPSGIPRNYGIDFFIWSTPGYPMTMVAGNAANLAAPTWQYHPFPSEGLKQYFDYILGGAPVTSPQTWDDCMTDAFNAGTSPFGTGGAMTFPGM